MTASIAISGAGIGGLTAALALARRGWQVCLFERMATLQEAGAGIQLSPNAMKVLAGLGLGETLEPHLTLPTAIVIRRGHDDSEVVRMPLANAAARWGAPWGVIHRHALQAALAQAVAGEPAIRLHLGNPIEALKPDSSGVEVLLQGGKGFRVDAAIGADGLWSTARLALGLREPPVYAGKWAWRLVAPMAGLPPTMQGAETTLRLHSASHLVHYPVSGGQSLNLVAVTHEQVAGEPQWSREPRSGDAIAARFKGWAPQLVEALAAQSGWRTWPLHDRPAATIMAAGRIALLGDAAHPMLPFLAQGAAAAIEDAAVLAACLAPGEPDVPAALQRYANARLARVGRIQAEARQNGARYHWPWPFSAARDAGMKALGGDRLLARYDWLYGWRPPQGEQAPPASSP
jgi:salicylate hydroxylase